MSDRLSLPADLKGDYEISLLDIISFLQESWKKLAVASIVGAALGISGWFFLGIYSAEYVLLNNYTSNNNYALDLVSWKMLQKSLPNLADQIINENKAPDDQQPLFKAMSTEQWWQKNAIPTYALSKADTKDLAGISKDWDTASTTIINLTLTATGKSKEQSIENVRLASNFLRTGGAYLQVRSLLNNLESQTLSTAADVQQKITVIQREMAYQQSRVKALEDLLKRFPLTPNGATVNQQGESSNSYGKYLPLTTQIIAANLDINQSKEDITRLQGRLSQIALTKEFLQLALPLQDQTFDGLVLDQKLLDVESTLRNKVNKNDSNGEQFLNDLHARLLDIKVRFTKGLEANTAPTSSGKKGMIKTTAGGFLSALFLMLLVLLGQKVWVSVKSDGVK